MYKKDTKIMCAVFSKCFFLNAFPLCDEVKFDNFSVWWLNIAYFYLHVKQI